MQQPISTEGKLGLILGLLALGGTGAIMIWPDHTELGWAMIAIAVAGGAALACYHLGESNRYIQKAMAISLMVLGAVLFFTGAIWLGVGSQINIEARQVKIANTSNGRTPEHQQNFELVSSWSVSFQFPGGYSGSISDSLREPFYIALHHAEFSNLSTTQGRVLDIKVSIPTRDSTIQTLALSTTTEFQSYRRSLTNKGIIVDEEALGRSNALLKNPIKLGPQQFLEGTVEFDIDDRDVKQKFVQQPEGNPFEWLNMSDATIYVTDRRSGITRQIKFGQRYDAITGTTSKTIQ
jgi:hypothetical protein